MNSYFRKFYYGDIPEENQEAEISFHPLPKQIGRCGKFLSAANKGWITNTLAVYMPRMPKWQLKMQEMFIQEEWKE